MTARQALAAISLLAATLEARRGLRPVRLRVRARRRWQQLPPQAKPEMATWYSWGGGK